MKVSIFTMTYNHMEYIKKALDSFLMQKTKFDFEIIVHDDCSNDGTIDVLKEYEAKYDNIKVIYEKENQFNNPNKRIYTSMMKEIATGEYIAYCEGDDYWMDEYKLQKQVDVMDANIDCSMCLHKVDLVDDKGNFIQNHYPLNVLGGKYSSEEFLNIRIAKGEYFQTSSYFLRGHIYKHLIDLSDLKKQPEFVRISRVGDEVLMNYMALKGNVYYINESMSCYRVESKSSIMKLRKKSSDYNFVTLTNLIDVLCSFDEYSNGVYKKIISKRLELLIPELEFFKSLKNSEKTSDAYKKLLSKECRPYYIRLSKMYKLCVWLAAYAPRILKIALTIMKKEFNICLITI